MQRMLLSVVGEAKANLKSMVERREKEKINEINGQPVRGNYSTDDSTDVAI